MKDLMTFAVYESFPFFVFYRGSRGKQRALSFFVFLLLCDVVSYSKFWRRISWHVRRRHVGESWATLEPENEKQEWRRNIPSPHSPGLLTSFPSVSAVLWCTGAPRSLLATVWCVWSVWSKRTGVGGWQNQHKQYKETDELITFLQNSIYFKSHSDINHFCDTVIILVLNKRFGSYGPKAYLGALGITENGDLRKWLQQMLHVHRKLKD